MISELSISTENFRFSLPVCLFPINILVYRLGFKSAIFKSKILARVQYSNSNSSIKMCDESENPVQYLFWVLF